MRNINEYNQDEFQTQFENTEICKKIKNDFDFLVWDKHVHGDFLYPTGRQYMGVRTCSMTSFYYIEKLLENNPPLVYDLGCGWNLFKRYHPTIIGISPDEVSNDKVFFGDEFDFFDDEFVKYHREEYEAIMAICSLHYYPLSLLKETAPNFISLVKPGGRGYISFDITTMLEREDPEILNGLFGTAEPSSIQVDDYVIEQLSDLPCKYLIFDADTVENKDQLDGDVRLVFEKPME
jgi:hypothetical protein